MKVIKVKVGGDYSRGSCNFCSKGELNHSGMGLIYPYDYILDLKGDAISVRICEECFEKLKTVSFKNIKELENDRKTNEIEL